MRKNGFLLVKVAGLFIAAVLLASCYAPLADQKGFLNIDLRAGARSGPGLGATSQVIVLVINADYEASLRETLWLIDKGKNQPGLSGAEADRLTELGKQMATSGLVKFGGFPFYQTTISGTGPGSFEIPGVPAGRAYFVKLYVFKPNFSFKVEDIDANFGGLILYENPVFGTQGSEVYTTPWADWPAGQSVPVTEGQSAAINMTLAPPP